MNGTRFRLLALSLTVLALPGCHISRPADPARRATAPLPGPDAWPGRDLDAVRGLQERTPAVIRTWEPNGLIPVDELGEESRVALNSIDRTIIANRLTDHGLLRVWSYPGDETEVFSANWLFGGGFLENASFLTSRDASGHRLERAKAGLPAFLGTPRREENTRRPGLQLTHTRQSTMLGAGIDLRIPTDIRGHGVLIVLGGLYSTSWQETSIDLFARAGWDVLRIDPATRVRRPNDAAFDRVQSDRSAFVLDRMKSEPGSVSEGREAARAEARVKFPLPPLGFDLGPDRDPAEVGRVVARQVDDLIAENAFAAQAAVEYLVDTHGRDALGPIAVIGYSGGSLGAPAVAARLRAIGVPVDALILIGSGADLLTISRTSRRSNGGIDLTSDGRFAPTREQLAAAHEAYLRHTALDAYALGPALADIPTLLMIASHDEWVPNGDLLDERLGEPDRIRYFGGHGGLFYFLPQQTPRMVRWLDGAVSTP
jgi:surfactin synthase thioesterase subunit